MNFKVVVRRSGWALFLALLCPAWASGAAGADVRVGVSDGVLLIETLSGSGVVQVEDEGAGRVLVYSRQIRGCAAVTDAEQRRCRGVREVHFVGGDMRDELEFRSASELPVRADGHGGSDMLTGSAGPDQLDGGPGDDYLIDDSPVASDDVFAGGEGVDTLDYESARDVAIWLPDPGGTRSGNGSPGENDHIASIENVQSGSGNDLLNGSSADNLLEGGLGTDDIRGGAGSDRLAGEYFDFGAPDHAPDAVHGDAGDDILRSRDAAAGRTECGTGTDTVRADLELDSLESCERLEPDIVGEPQPTGPLRAGSPVALTGFTVLGSKPITVTTEWGACGSKYCGGAFLVAPEWTPTPAQADNLSVSFYANIRATNAVGEDLAGPTFIDRQRAPQAATSPLATPVQTAGTATPTPVPSPAALARQLMGGRAVKLGGLAHGPLTGYRPSGQPQLSTGRATLVAALVCRPASCSVTLTPHARTPSRLPAEAPPAPPHHHRRLRRWSSAATSPTRSTSHAA
ncbi:hypothetical protein LRS13_12700 [Svornostia abyssi]|uniref:Calcium-binding protein n=1 Tax=Svornostia abyssi TaxID=2898438 RepID=A0ABY5PAF5_9ACTN|nr:hypothetical protein LRS13_12700 [Parviterribacteraceae bacterium J379]